MDYWNNMIDIIYIWLSLIISITVHEFAHAITSYKLGDPTPKLQDRLTLNPLSHVDLIWFLSVFVINFWRWRPVQVDPRFYKNPILDELIVALAWPFSNFLLAFIGIWLYVYLLNFNYIEVEILNRFLYIFSFLNIALAIFNLLPLPPLDWYRLVKFFFPKLWYLIDQYLLYLSIFFLLIMLNPSTWTIIRNYIVSSTESIFDIIFLFFKLINV